MKKFEVSENIEFLGQLSEQQMKEKMLESNVFVQASAIENSPNSLGEAMLLSMPCIASNVGGTSTLLVHGKQGLLYPYTETSMLAYYIEKVFSDDKLAIDLGQEAYKQAILTHDRDVNYKILLEIYKDVVNNERNYR